MKQGLFLICPTGTEADALNKIARIDSADAFLYEGSNALPEIKNAVQAKNIAFIVENDAELALKLGADGVQVPYAKGLKNIKAALGDLALGVVCSTRDEAMRAGEAGADYIAFDGEKAAELALWWIELFTVPCLSLTAPCEQADFKVARL